MVDQSARPRQRTRSLVAHGGAIGILAVVLGACSSGGPGAAPPIAGTGTVAGASTPVAERLSPRDLATALKRSGVGPDQVAIDLTYAPPMFFEITELVPPPEMSEQPTLAFMLEETVHDGSLSDAPPTVLLVLEDNQRATPYQVLITATDPHHRTTRLLFADPGSRPLDPMDPGPERVLTLIVPFADGTVSAGNTFAWRLPLDLAASMPSASPGASK